MLPKMAKVLIDVNSIILRRGKNYLSGIGRTTLDLLKGLASLPSLPFEIQLYYQGSDSRALDHYSLPFPHFFLPLPNTTKYSKVITRLRIKELFTKYDLLHIPHNFSYVARPEKTLVTFHDAMFFSYPESFLGHDYARMNCPKLASECKGIVTCSISSKKDIVKYMNIPEEKVTVIPWGISKDVFYPEDDKIIEKVKLNNNLSRPYFIMVSCDIGRKNTISLLKAYQEYLSQGGSYDMVLVWSNPPEEIIAEFESDITNNRIHFLKNINDDDLRALYSGAISSFFPSKYEGFGLPILESMACGTPVVTCRNSSLVEVGGDMALYVGAEDLKALSMYMTMFEKKEIQELPSKERLLNYTEAFSWTKTANAYVDFYQKYL